MKIVRCELFAVTLPYKRPFRVSKFTFTDYWGYILRLTDESGLTGVGESIQLQTPWYGAEYYATAGLVLEQVLLPAILQEPFSDVEELMRRIGWVQGWQQAKAAVETAVCDLMAKAAGMPMYRFLGSARNTAETGVSIGLYDDPAELVAAVTDYLGQGFRRIKVKIAPGRDAGVLDPIRREYPDILLMADANASYARTDFAALESLDRYGLLMLEQPLQNGDFLLHADLQRRMNTPICLDESVHTQSDAALACSLHACRYVNVKPPRVGGPLQTAQMLQNLKKAGVGAWIGGMMETGIGRMMNLACAVQDGITCAGDIRPPLDYLAQDITENTFEQHDGFYTLHETPGLGAEVDWDRVEKAALRRVLLE